MRQHPQANWTKLHGPFCGKLPNSFSVHKNAIEFWWEFRKNRNWECPIESGTEFLLFGADCLGKFRGRLIDGRMEFQFQYRIFCSKNIFLISI
jgi:hypothetical protein